MDIKEECIENAPIKIEVEDEVEEELDDPWSFLTGQIKLEPLHSIPIIASTSHEDLKPILDVKKEVLASGSILRNLLAKKKQPPCQTIVKEEIDKSPTQTIKEEFLEIDDIYSMKSELGVETNYSPPKETQKKNIKPVKTIHPPSISNVKTIRNLNTELLKKEKCDDIFEPIININGNRYNKKNAPQPQDTMKTYKSHKLCSTSLKQYLCSICQKPFANIVTLVEHEQTHKFGKMFHCDVCSYHTSNERSLLKHSYFHRKGKQVYKCQGCNFSTIVIRQFKLHKAAHISKNMLKCNDCQYMCSDYDILSKHKLKHKAQTFQCDKCVFTSRRMYYLDMHKLIHLGTDKTNKCENCDYTGSHPRYLRLHKKMNSH